jgi:hypothetical protein
VGGLSLDKMDQIVVRGYALNSILVDEVADFCSRKE